MLPVLHSRADLLREALAAEAADTGVALALQHHELDALVERAARAASMTPREAPRPAAPRKGARPQEKTAPAQDLLPGLRPVPAAARAARGPLPVGVLSPVAQTLLIYSLCRDARPPLAGLSQSPSQRRALLRLCHAATLANLSPTLFARLLQRLPSGDTPRSPTAQARLSELARLYARYRGAAGNDVAQRYQRGLAQLAADTPPTLGDAPRLLCPDLHLCPDDGALPRWARLQALCALAQRAPEGPRRGVVIAMPDVEGRPALEAALAPLQEALYRLHEHDLEEQRVPLGPRDTSERRSGSAAGDQADDPYARFLRGLFQPAGSEPPLAADELPAAQLELLCAADPADEARAVAGAVRACLDQGIAPSAIAVIAGSAARRARLCEALQRLGVPACLLPPLAPTERRESVAQSPPLQALLGLYGLHHSGVPREALIRHLTSVYLRFFPAPPEGLPPWRVARALREAGIRDLGERPRRGAAGEPRPPGEEPDHRRRLREWLRERQREARSRRPVDDAGANDALVALGELNLPERRVLPLLDNALRLLSTLPERATLAGHCAALRRLCERLSFSECVRAGEGGLDAIRARDEDAEGALLYLLEELPGAARRLSREQEPYERAAFAELLQELLQQLPVHSAESALARQGTAVQIGDLGRLCGRRHARLFITGLCEGELPGRAQEDALLGDDERRGLNRLLGGDFFPLSSAGCAAAPLWFACALAHADAATLSYPAVDEDGRPVLRSALFDEAQRAAARPEPPRRPREPVPALEDVRSPAELWTRATLEARVSLADLAALPPGARPAAARRARAGRALLSALAAREPARAARIQQRIVIERERARFFTALSAQREAGLPDDALGADDAPYAGRLRDSALIETLQRKLPGSPQRALSASALEDYAKCPFRFFLRRVLKAAPTLWGGDDLDPMAGGRLHHAVLERFFKERQGANRLPLRGGDDDRRALDLAISAVLEGWEKDERTGHQALFAVRVRRLRDDLYRLIEREAREPILDRGVPMLFEHSFGPLTLHSASDPGGLPLSVQGVIDRVDMRPAILPDGRRALTALVLDYKAGRLDRYEGYLTHELLRTSFQLPLYAAAVRADPTLQQGGVVIDHVMARYYSLRSGRVSAAALDDPAMIALGAAQAQAPQRNVAEVAYHLWRRLRDGDFRVAPRTCEGCGMEAACRVDAQVVVAG